MDMEYDQRAKVATALEIKELIEKEEFKFLVVFYTLHPDSLIIHHYIMYESYPNEESILHNYEELKDDPDFKLEEDVLRKLRHQVLDMNDDIAQEFFYSMLLAE